MKVGIVSFFDYDLYIKPKKKLKIYEGWNKAWEEVFKLCLENNIFLKKYNLNEHLDYEKIIFVEIPRVTELIKVMYANLFRRRVQTILIINETFLGRARYILRIPFLFDKVFINCEDNLNHFMSYKISTFSYPSIPSKDIIKENKLKILNPERKNKLVFISSFKIALSSHGSYIFRYKLVRDLLIYKKSFKLFGFGWDKVPLPFDIIGIAVIVRIPFLKKLIKKFMGFYFKPLGQFPIAKSKSQTLQKYDFALAIEPTISKFNSICEKIFDPMLSGAIPVYYGQKILGKIPHNTYIRIDKKDSVAKIMKTLKNLTQEEKSRYRENIFNFLNSKQADIYRSSSYAKLIVNAILKNKLNKIL